MSGPEIITLGCRLNSFESEVMRAAAMAAGLENAVIVNTCAVTAEAERQARQAIRKLRRERPGVRVIVTGCAAQLHPERFAAMPEVDRVLGNSEKLVPEILAGLDTLVVSDASLARELAGPLIEGFDGRVRAFVQVQQGCDHDCTFCVVPAVRGPGRSAAPERVVAQARRLVANGHAEVVLTGLDASSYGRDRTEGLTLGSLAARVLEEVPELLRLRLTSLDPAVPDPALFELLEREPRLMPHLHLSVQSLDDLVLKRMKRRHSRADVAAFMARARRARPDVVFGADLIAGFPTEDEAMAGATLEGVRELDFLYLHVFPFSIRPGTPAARMPQVPGETRKARAAALRRAGMEALASHFAARIAGPVEVLLEREREGHSRHFAPVRLDVDGPVGAVVTARVTGTDGQRLLAERTP